MAKILSCFILVITVFFSISSSCFLSKNCEKGIILSFSLYVEVWFTISWIIVIYILFQQHPSLETMPPFTNISRNSHFLTSGKIPFSDIKSRDKEILKIKTTKYLFQYLWTTINANYIHIYLPHKYICVYAYITSF